MLFIDFSISVLFTFFIISSVEFSSVEFSSVEFSSVEFSSVVSIIAIVSPTCTTSSTSNNISFNVPFTRSHYHLATSISSQTPSPMKYQSWFNA